MGKDSLIKSTTKKKAKEEEKAKKSTPKKKASRKATKKAAPKRTIKTAAKAKKTTAKKKSPTKAGPKKRKPAAKPKPRKAAKPKPKTVAKKPVKKTTKKLKDKELLLKTFEPISKPPKPQPATPLKKSRSSAPPFVSAADPKENARIRSLLLQSHDIATITAAANAPNANLPKAAPSDVVQSLKEKTSTQEGEYRAPHTNGAGTPQLPTESASDPVSNAAKLLAVCVGIVILMLFMASYTNSSKYYIEPKDNAIEIWKGRFSPKDQRFFMVLHGTQLLGKAKEVYSRAEVYPMIFDYFLGKADTLLEVPGLPDFEGIKSYLHDAEKYAINGDKRKSVDVRLKNIDRMILIYKADVSISQGTLKSLDAAIKHLKSAKALITNATQEQEIQQKLSLATTLKAALKAKPNTKEN